MGGCSTEKKTVPQPADPEITEITGIYWKLIELNGSEITGNNKINKEPHFILIKEKDRITGTGGCNIFNGSYTIEKGGRIYFSEMITTMMSCPDMSIERKFMEILAKCDNYTITGNILHLNKARMAPLAKFQAVP